MSNEYERGLQNGEARRDREQRQHRDFNGMKVDQAKIEAKQVTMQADIVRLDKGLGIVVHTIEGNGVEGLADEVKEIKVWISAQSVSSQQADARDEKRTEQHKVNRNRGVLIAISIIGSIILLANFISTVSGWVRSMRSREPVEIIRSEPKR